VRGGVEMFLGAAIDQAPIDGCSLLDIWEPLGWSVTVGYTNEYAFSRAFSRAWGVAPGRFRREEPT
jgi:hypothetical protein